MEDAHDGYPEHEPLRREVIIMNLKNVTLQYRELKYIDENTLAPNHKVT